MGLYKVLDLSGARYFLIIVDDKTRATWTYLLPNKTHVCPTFISLPKFVKNHFHARMKQIRSDNGPEVVKHECRTYFLKKGIIHQTSLSHTLHQNGVVERKHRHLLDITRALRIHAYLPKHFWGDCILTATYLINRMSMSVLGWKTPFEALHGHKPSYDHLRVMDGVVCALLKVLDQILIKCL